MEKTDSPRLTLVLKRLCGTFGRQFTADLFDGYLAALIDVPIDLVEVNALAALRAGDRMPMPRDLRAGVNGTSEETPESQALAAWTDVRGRIKTREPPTDRLALAIVDHFGGLHKMGDQPPGEVHGFMRREFVKLYAQRARDEMLHGAKQEVRALLETERLGLPT